MPTYQDKPYKDFVNESNLKHLNELPSNAMVVTDDGDKVDLNETKVLNQVEGEATFSDLTSGNSLLMQVGNKLKKLPGDELTVRKQTENAPAKALSDLTSGSYVLTSKGEKVDLKNIEENLSENSDKIDDEKNRAQSEEARIEKLFTQPVEQSVSAWLDAHPDATTTVVDKSLTEEKLSDELYVKTIKDYVTPEMFGAVGNGVTDDAEALSQALNSGKVVFLVPGKVYQSSPIEVNNSVRLFGFGSTIKAVNKNQTSILTFKKRDIFINDVSFDGCGAKSVAGIQNDESFGMCEGLIFDAASNGNINLLNVNIWSCKTGIRSSHVLWDSSFKKVRMNLCCEGVKTEAGVLEVMFETCYWNQCKTSVNISYGCSTLLFVNCSWGSVVNNSVWFKNGYPSKNVSFESCNFEEVFVGSSSGAFCFTSSSCSFSFKHCIFHVIKKVDGATNTAIFYSTFSTSENKVSFDCCLFDENSSDAKVNYQIYCKTGSKGLQFQFDWTSFKSMLYSHNGGILSLGNVYSGSEMAFRIVPYIIADTLPKPSVFGDFKNFFSGTFCFKNKDASFYVFDGNDWIEMTTDVVARLSNLERNGNAVEKNPNEEVSLMSFISDVPEYGERIFYFRYDVNSNKIKDRPNGMTTKGLVKFVRNGDVIYIYWYSGILDDNNIFVARVSADATEITSWKKIIKEST